MTEQQKDYERQTERGLTRLYEAMSHMAAAQSRMAAAQSHFWTIQEEHYQRLEEIDKKQSTTAKILEKLEKKLNDVNN
ncbi:MAG: hypothetical protein AAGF26_00905 [Cyanobacteria bacterium P01_G01_bin.49]